MTKTELIAYEAMTAGSNGFEAVEIFLQKMRRELNIDWPNVARMVVEHKMADMQLLPELTNTGLVLYNHRAEIYIEREE